MKKRIFSTFLGTIILTTTILAASLPISAVPVYADGTGKKLQLGASTLSNNAVASGVATVYYGNNNQTWQTWRVIGYGTTGVASETGKLALLAGSNMGSSTNFNDNSSEQNCNDYAGSNLKGAVDAIYSSTYFTGKEMGAIIKRNLNVQEYTDTDPYPDGISGTALTENDAPNLWPLSTKEAYTLMSNGSGLTNIGVDWWLRSPGKGPAVAFVDRDGDVHKDGILVTYGEYEYGVRPAFNINLSSIILTSAAVNGKDAGATIGALKEVDPYSRNEWKLTILDSSRSGFTASAGTGATLSQTERYTTWTVPVAYTWEGRGTNEHVSAILTDSNGVALYYGHIDHSVTIPTGLTAGTYYLKVFCEECNGDKKTDYSSPMSTIALSVLEKAAKPSFSVTPGTYTEAQNVTLACETTGATIYYTTDGSDPSTSSTRTEYTGTITVDKTTTIRTIATKTGLSNSEEASATYTINLPKVEKPTFSPAGGTYTEAKNVEISCSTSGATIYYTTNGEEPSASSTEYTGDITLAESKTIKAIAVKSGMTDSDVAEATYTINIPGKVSTPTFSPAGGTFSEAQDVTISCATDGATIYYTKDGSTPTATSPTYNGPITVSKTTTIKAIAVKDGMTDSGVGTASYTISADPIRVTGVSLSQTEITLKPEATKKLTATIEPEDATDKDVTWKSDDESIATVSDDGTVTAVAEGETTITVTTNDGNKTDTCKVTVKKDAPVVETCTITFDANDGKGDMDPQTVDKGTSTKLKKNKFTREGYAFDSWNTQADGKGKSYKDKDEITVEEDTTLYAQWKEGEPEPEDDDDDDHHSDHTPPSWVLNPNEKQQLVIIFTGTPAGLTAGYQEQGEAAQGLFKKETPAGWKKAFSFNILKDGKADYSLKNGTLTLIIPTEYQKPGRQFALLAMGKNGQVMFLADTDTDPKTITVNVAYEGYAMELIYKD